MADANQVDLDMKKLLDVSRERRHKEKAESFGEWCWRKNQEGFTMENVVVFIVLPMLTVWAVAILAILFSR